MIMAYPGSYHSKTNDGLLTLGLRDDAPRGMFCDIINAAAALINRSDAGGRARRTPGRIRLPRHHRANLD